MREYHRYNVKVTWTGNTGTGTSAYDAYSRNFTVDSEGRPTIPGSSDPGFRGDPTRWNPEQLLLAALSSCHKLWFLHLAADSGVAISEYVDRAEGTLRIPPGEDTGSFERVTLRPEVTVTAASDESLVPALHKEAHRRCFIANSVNFAVHCEPVTARESI